MLSFLSGMAKTAFPAAGIVELFYNLKLNLLHWHEYHLSDSLARLNFIRLVTSIPAGNKNLALVVRIYEAGQIAEHQSMLVPEPGSRQQDRRKRRIADVYSQPCWHQHRLSRRNRQNIVDAGTHIETG